jgi:TolB-like protein
LKSDESSQQPNYKNRNNPLTPLADSPEELQHLMTELQKVARTQRYLALREQKKRDAMKENAPEIDAATPSYGGIFANSKVQINDYAQQMAGKLAKFSSLEGASVGVASFVKFDDTLRYSTSLGNQFAEAVATELPRFGVSVVDFKLTKQIEVSSRGDLSLTREGEKLIGKTDMEYILTGTLVVTSRGVQINSRVVSVDTRNVIAAASTFLPKEVLQQIQP